MPDSWKSQLQQRLQGTHDFSARFGLSLDPRLEDRLSLGVTPYYAELCAQHPALLKTILPDARELEFGVHELADPMAEEPDSPVPAVVRRYPNRALLLLSPHCPVYCRYCTRSRKVGKASSKLGPADWAQGIQWIAEQPQIEEVILSGGEPLMLSDEALGSVLSALQEIPHLRFLRFSSKAPAVLPQRITPDLAKLLGRFRPLMNLHFTHPAELTPETILALSRLHEAGVLLASQTVLLKGVNDEVSVLAELFKGLMERQVRPYALYLCDWITGAGHFRVGPSRALALMEQLRRELSGPMLPRLIADPPGGKAEVGPGLRRSNEGVWLINWKGEEVLWPE
ncbi:MAG: KamA family radical SAM protein [bacterium]|nr:KamA family radical SAM protein [bacterium]